MPGNRGRKDSTSDSGTVNHENVGTFETRRDEGEHFVHVQNWTEAIKSFTKALELKENDPTCLVLRAKCYLLNGDAEKALKDANTALEQDKEGKDIKAVGVKAEALYKKGDFETALVFYHRGNRLRPELSEFRLGIQKCQEAINNSIGSPSSVKLDTNGDLSFFYKQEEKKQQQRGYIGKPVTQKKEEKKDRVRPKTSTNAKTTKELLGQLYQDKEYLEKLYDAMTSDDRFIRERACDGLEYLNARADFWRQQKPMYARKRDKDRQREKQGHFSNGAKTEPMKYILGRLEEIDDAQADGNYELCLKKSKSTLEKVEAMDNKEVSNQPEVVANLHSCIGNAYLELGSYEAALKHHKLDLQIAKEKKIEEAHSRALDNIGRTYARIGNYQKAIDTWTEKLPMSKSPVESTWLFHEIGRCHLELGHNREACDFGEKSLAAAKECGDQGWQLHATVLIAQAEVKCRELEAAAETFGRALEMAEAQHDQPAVNAIKRALEDVNNQIVKGVEEDDKKSKAEDNLQLTPRGNGEKATSGADGHKDTGNS